MKRLISFILALSIIFSCIPMAVFATDNRTEATGLAGGSGTQADPYTISSYGQLVEFEKNVNSGITYKGKYVKLTADITANNTQNFDSWSFENRPANQFKTMNNFGGSFDGGNHTITGLYIAESDTNYLGFFGRTLDGADVTVKNLYFQKAYINSEEIVNENGSQLIYATGGFVGYATVLTITDCIMNGVIYGTSSTGGMVGEVNDTGIRSSGKSGLVMKNCYNYADVTGSNSLGGLVGQVKQSNYSNRYLQIENCHNKGDIKGFNKLGGIAGSIDSSKETQYSFVKCSNEGDVTADNNYAGGIAGYINTFRSVKNHSQLSNSGNITAGNRAGGIIGEAEADGGMNLSRSKIILTDAYNNGKIHVTSTRADTRYVGGIMGNSVVSDGNSKVEISNCFNAGQVTGLKSYAILGNNTLYSSYSGIYSAVVSNSYYLNGSAVEASHVGSATVLSAQQMMQESSFKNFDFADTWQMSSFHPVFSWQYSSLPPIISNSDIVRLVAKYTSQDLYEQYEEIMYGTRYDSVEEKHKRLQALFRYNGITDVQEGISYLSSTTGERRAYLGLMTDEMYTATNYRNWLTKKPSGLLFRAVLIADGLAFNNEINDWISFPTYLEGEYPGVKKYMAMLYDFMDTAANQIEAQTYIKTLSDISSKLTGENKDYVEDFINQLNSLDNVGRQRELMKSSDLWDKVAGDSVRGVAEKTDDGVKFKFSFNETSGIYKFAKAMDIAVTTVSLVDVSMTNFLEMQKFDARRKAYVYFKDFLTAIKDDRQNIPYELRWAAENVMFEMENGYAKSMYDFVVELTGATKLNDIVFDKIFTKLGVQAGFSSFLLQINILSFFSNCFVNLGETVQNVAFVEGYAAMAQTFKEELEDAELKFTSNPTETNAWDFVYNYDILYMLREKGEEYYIMLADFQGIGEKWADSLYTGNREVAAKTLALLRSDFRFDISGISAPPESVQFMHKMVVDCPVDVYVYDSVGNLVATLKDGTESDVTNSHGRFTVIYDIFTDEYTKVICLLTDDNYKIEIIGVDKGLVNLSVAYKDGTEIKKYQFTNQKTEKDTVFMTTVEDIKSGNGYTIDTDGDGVAESTGVLAEPSTTAVHVQSVEIQPQSITVCKGTDTVLGVAVVPATATNQSVAWFTENSDVATIKNGKLTAVSEGSTTITALSADKDVAEIMDQCVVTVIDHAMSNGACTNCGKSCDGHTGGTADCQNKAVCSICGAEYGEPDMTNHTGTLEWVQTAEKHSQKYSCCGTVSTEEENHSWTDGKCDKCEYVCEHTDTDENGVCHICGTQLTPETTPTPSPDVTPTPSPEPTVTPEVTPTPTPQPSAEPTPTNTPPAVHIHYWNLTLQMDSTHHWYQCYDCGRKDEYGVHTNNAEGYCSKCGHYTAPVITEPTPSIAPTPAVSPSIEPSAEPIVQPSPSVNPQEENTQTESNESGVPVAGIGIGAAVLIAIIILFKKKKSEE